MLHSPFLYKKSPPIVGRHRLSKNLSLRRSIARWRGNPFLFSRSNNVHGTKRSTDCHVASLLAMTGCLHPLKDKISILLSTAGRAEPNGVTTTAWVRNELSAATGRWSSSPNCVTTTTSVRDALSVRIADMQKPRQPPRFLQQEKRRGKMKKMVGSNL